jgi:uncharacterized peroxidase-related enzyme
VALIVQMKEAKDMSSNDSSTDLMDALVPLSTGDPARALRHQRDKVVAATQGSHEAIFDPAITGLTMVERLLAAHEIARLSECAPLLAHYRAVLRALPALDPEMRAIVDGSADVQALPLRLRAVLHFAATLSLRPVEGDKASLLALVSAGLATADVVLLAQLIAYVSYQVRVLVGLQALASAGAVAVATAPVGEAPVAFVHPANLPPPGEPLRINGYTSETLGWKAWLPVVDLAQASAEQLAVLQSSHPKAMTSDYYRLLVHQARVLDQRSVVFNAIMYAPGGLSRAERELASAVVSRVNGCVYCASVHAQRFEQLTKRNDVIAQVFTDPLTAGTNARERAIVQLAIDLTLEPGRFGATQLSGVRSAGLGELEILDLLHAVAIFAWANRLMLNLGEPIFGG